MWADKIDRYLTEHKMDVAETLSRFVQCNTNNPGDPCTGNETAMRDHLIPKLQELGMETDVRSLEEHRPNVVGIMRGKGGGRDLLFNGHTDTVPIGDPEKWKYGPYDGTIADGRVYGRGATDCKTGLAASYWALRTIKELGIPLKGDAYYIASAGEESNEGGTLGVKVALTDDYKDPFCVVAESSNLEIYPTSTGLFFFELTIPGKPCHIGKRNLAIYPQNYNAPCGWEVGVDPLEKALPYIDYFYRLERSWAIRLRDPMLGGGGMTQPDKRGVGVFTITPVAIHGDMYFGSVIDEVTIKYGVWYPEFADRDKLIQEIIDGVNAVAATDAWTVQNPPKLKIPIEQIWRGFKTDYDHPGIGMLANCCETVTGKAPVVTGFTAVADATYISQAGIPVVICGAGSGSNRSHGYDEYADIDEVVAAAKIYANMLVNWCGVEE